MLTDATAIRAVLARLVADRRPIDVRVDEGTERFQSLVVDIDLLLGALIIDELHPRRGHALVGIGSLVNVSSRIDGVDVRFSVRVRALDTEGGIAAYLSDLPAVLDYREQRGLFRLRIPVGAGIDAWISNTEHRDFAARVLDISTGGIRLAVPAPHPLKPADAWVCNVHLPNGAFAANLRILRVRNFSARYACQRRPEGQVGARFRNLSLQADHHIGQYMAAAQRELIRAVPSIPAER
jgi:c-di-GMP-binding flagellar brake protein YcgR